MATNPAIAMPGQAAEELDPITFEVLRNAFEYTCGRMTTILQRTSFSPILSDMLDFSNAICDSQVRLLGQSGNPVHLAAMQYSARAPRRYSSPPTTAGDASNWSSSVLVARISSTGPVRNTTVVPSRLVT